MHEILQTSHEILHIVGLFPNEVVCRPFEEKPDGSDAVKLWDFCSIAYPIPDH